MMEPVAWRWAWKTTGSEPEQRFADPDLYEWTYRDRPPSKDAALKMDVEPLVRLSDAEVRIAELEEEIGRLEDENSDLRCEPWPEWARAVLKVIRKHSGYDGYDDATEGVDMPLELSEHLSEMDAEVGRWKARAEAAEAPLKEAREALEPFASGKHEMRNTHLLEWLTEGYGHCKRGSEDWAQSYLNSARDYIKAFEAVARALKEKP